MRNDNEWSKVEGEAYVHPHTLLNKVGQILDQVGSKKFFSSSDEEVKKAREGFAAYFFSLALKKWTNRDWWLAQRQYPDFAFFSFGDNPNSVKIERVELTGVYPHFQNFEKMMEVIDDKKRKYGNNPLNFSLLVFVNHGKSEEWIKILRGKLITEHPFLSVWTIHLLFKKGGKEVGKAVAQRIKPLPGLRIEANTDDQEIHKIQPLPSYLEKKKEGGSVYITFKPDFINKFRKQIS